MHNHRPTFAAYRAFCSCTLYKFENNYLICRKCKKQLRTTSANNRKRHSFEALINEMVVAAYVICCVLFFFTHAEFKRNLIWLFVALVLANVVDYVYFLLLCRKGYFQELQDQEYGERGDDSVVPASEKENN